MSNKSSLQLTPAHGAAHGAPRGATVVTVVEVAPLPPPVDPAALLLLDDPLNVNIVITWHLVPAAVRAADSLFDMASYSSRVAGCDLDVAIARLHTLLGLGILHPGGGVDPTVASYLRGKGSARVNGADGHDATGRAEALIAGMSTPELAEFLNRAAPKQLAELTWDDDDDAE